MSTIGFKASWHKPTRKNTKKQEMVIPEIIPGTSTAHILELQMKIDEHEQYMLTSAYGRLKKKDKFLILDAYRFLVVSLATINHSNMVEQSGISFYSSNDIDIHEE